MPVYVDELQENINVCWYCKMFADTMSELHAMAKRLGLDLDDFKTSPPSNIPHYMLTQEERDRALAAGCHDASSEEWWDDGYDVAWFWWSAAHHAKKLAGVDEDATDW